jgi:cation-transporting ATPase 13A3/4/5
VAESLPKNFDEILDIYTDQGFRVLAIATKALKINYLKSQKIHRDEVESGLQFIGLLIMQNKLKPVTTGVIETLNHSNIRTIMATGDNVLTAISVGRQCNIIESDAEVFLGDIRRDE